VAASIFLNSFSEARAPLAAEQNAFRAAQKRDFQAEAALPLFWLAMFHSTDVRPADDANAVTEDAYLVTAAARAAERLWRRRRGVLINVGLRYADLYDDFRRIVRDEMGPYVLVRESASLPAAQRAAHRRELADALDAFTMLDMATEFPKNAALRGLIGFDALAASLGTPRAPYLMTGRDLRKQWPREGAVYEETSVGDSRIQVATRWEMWKKRGSVGAKRAELAQRFLKEAITADAQMQASGLGYTAEDVHAYIDAKVRGENPRRPRLKRWRT
jgi:hypothetical protein